MSKILIIGDVHFGKGVSIGKPSIGQNLNSRVIDQFNLLEWCFEQAIENDVSTIIFTGDLYEAVRPEFYLIEFFIKWLQKCSDNNLIVHIIMGNHDIKRSGNYYSSPLDLIETADIENVFVYRNISTVINGSIGITFLPFCDRHSFNLNTITEVYDKLQNNLLFEAKSIPDTYDKILIGHLTIEGALKIGDEYDDSAKELMCPMHLFDNYDYIWFGHIHKPQILNKKPHISHIGSLDISDYGEALNKKILILFDSELPNKFKQIPIPSRPLRRLRLTIEENVNTTEFIIVELKKLHEKYSFENAYLKIEIKLIGANIESVNKQIIEEFVYGLGVFYISSFTETRSVVVVPLEKRQNIDTIISPKVAIKMYSEQISFENSEEKDMFLNICNEIIELKE